ncbi:oxygenase MpaB family protein [Allokutzneria sp. NRRL B-24872]|uniref:oxygenase MpaB family protein n=1 Tax=Allokutzneria sp. NRRL B-24872 TaxID=1137961 RepID=UPI000A39A9B4|nr:oxygenase MpaB family protein [Allokutzneria sp. NRRL B-24872]
MAIGLKAVRQRVGASVFERVAGPDGPANRDRIDATPGPRWFAEDSAIRRVHSDASMFVGGLRALLLQSLHPLAMAAVAGHSGYRSDPWGRLQRTSTFLAMTTFGTAQHAEEAIAHVRAVHERIRGTAPDGRRYRASDPRLLGWVHAAEVDSFLRCYQRYGPKPLSPEDADSYVADTSRIASGLGVLDPPRSVAELAAVLDDYRPELRGTAQARDTARFLLFKPPLPLLARAPYTALASAAVAALPSWTRWPLRLPYFPPVERTAVQLAGHGIVGLLRWAMT